MNVKKGLGPATGDFEKLGWGSQLPSNLCHRLVKVYTILKMTNHHLISGEMDQKGSGVPELLDVYLKAHPFHVFRSL